MAARMPMIATTIINSIRVKPFWMVFSICKLSWMGRIEIRGAIACTVGKSKPCARHRTVWLSY